MTAPRSSLLVAALALSMSACSGGGGPTAIELQIDSLAFTSTCPVVSLGRQCQLGVAAFTAERQRIGNPVLRWSSFDFQVAEVDEDGVVTGKGPGSATIEVSNTTGTTTARTDVLVAIPKAE